MSNQNQNQIVALPAIQLADKKTLMTLLGSLFEKIDNLASDGKINSGEYKEFADIVSDMSKIKQEVRTHIIYRTIERQARRKEPKQPSTELKKREMSDYVNCEFCDKRIAKSYILTHKSESITCQRVQQTKQNVVLTRKKYSPELYAMCQSYNVELLPRYRPIKKLKMTDEILKALGIRKPEEIIQEGNTYKKGLTTKKIDGVWRMVDTWELVVEEDSEDESDVDA